MNIPTWRRGEIQQPITRFGCIQGCVKLQAVRITCVNCRTRARKVCLPIAPSLECTRHAGHVGSRINFIPFSSVFAMNASPELNQFRVLI